MGQRRNEALRVNLDRKLKLRFFQLLIGGCPERHEDKR